MIANILAILLGLACAALVPYEIRRAYRRGYEAGLAEARRICVDVASGCCPGDGTDAYEAGRHGGAVDIECRLFAASYKPTEKP